MKTLTIIVILTIKLESEVDDVEDQIRHKESAAGSPFASIIAWQRLAEGEKISAATAGSVKAFNLITHLAF